MARNRSNLLYADIVTSGDVVETIPDDISTMDESSQNKETSAQETSFEGLQFQTATAKNSITLLVNVDTNISWPPDSGDLKFENAVNALPNELVNFLIVILGFSDKILFSEKVPIREDKMGKKLLQLFRI